MPSEPLEEIDSLKGELAAARWCIGFLYGFLLRFADDETRCAVLGKIGDINTLSDNDFIRHGSDRFKEKLLEQLSKFPTDERHDESPE